MNAQRDPVEAIVDAVRREHDRRGFAFFEGEHFDVNLVGLRSWPRNPDAFDDTLVALWREERTWRVFAARATTDPGVRALELSAHPDGVSRIAPGQYRRVWAPGVRGSNGRPWLAQVGTFIVQRDRDGNTTYDEAAPTFRNGQALGLHEPWKDGLTKVGRASEGCQVPFSRAAALRFIELVRLQAQAGMGERVTYTLHDERVTPRLGFLRRLC